MGNKQIKAILSVALSEIITPRHTSRTECFPESVVRAIFPAQPSKTMVKKIFPLCRVTHELCGKNRKNRPSHPVRSSVYIINCLLNKLVPSHDLTILQ